MIGGMKSWIAVLGLAVLAQPVATDKEKALGAGLMTEVRREARPVDISEAQTYAAAVAARLGGGVQVEVLAVEADRPWGFPGGYVVVPAGFLARAESEWDVAAAIGRAMGQVALRHGVVSPRGPGTIPMVYMGGWTGNTQMMPQAAQEQLKAQEPEAVRFGESAARQAGFEPGGAESAEFVQARESVRAALAVPARRAPSLRR